METETLEKMHQQTGRGEIIALNISPRRGTAKQEVPQAKLVRGFGIEGDAHGGNWHRQVSLLSFEKITAFNQRGAKVKNGDFGENIIVSGFDLRNLPVGTILQIGSGQVVVSQIGKECHDRCQIYALVGDCIMPREGIFAIVIKEGLIKPGDTVEIL